MVLKVFPEERKYHTENQAESRFRSSTLINKRNFLLMGIGHRLQTARGRGQKVFEPDVIDWEKG
jgi:hypothetical protein